MTSQKVILDSSLLVDNGNNTSNDQIQNSASSTSQDISTPVPTTSEFDSTKNLERDNFELILDQPEGVASCSSTPSILCSPKSKPRSILKRQKTYTVHDEVVAVTLNLLCSVPPKQELLYCVDQVFHNFCIKRLFNGECVSSSCSKSHTCAFESFTSVHSSSVIWNVSLYTICFSCHPDLQVLKNLACYFFVRKDVEKTLAFSLCYTKLKENDATLFAEFLINCLSILMDKKQAITRMLMLTYSQMDFSKANLFLEKFGVFEEDPSSYTDLMIFLNDRKHQFSSCYLMKILNKVQPTSNVNTIKHALIDFVSRIPVEELIDQTLSSVISQFKDTFSIDDQLLPQNSTTPQLALKSDSQTRKTVQFGFVRTRFLEESKWSDDGGEWTDDDSDGSITLNDGVPQKDLRSKHCLASLIDVFGETCPDWVLNAICNEEKCPLSHCLPLDPLKDKSLRNVCLAAHFFIDNSITPNYEVLEAFINYFHNSDAKTKMLIFRKLASKLSISDSSNLTKLILLRLSQSFNKWDAIEMLMAPNILGMNQTENSDSFLFNKDLLRSIMATATKEKNHIHLFLAEEIIKRVGMLPLEDSQPFVAISTDFFLKFIVKIKHKVTDCPDLIESKSNSLTLLYDLQLALDNGGNNKYFYVNVHLGAAVRSGLEKQARYILQNFLLKSSNRASILDHILKNCKLFGPQSGRMLREMVGEVGLTLIIKLHQEHSKNEFAETFNVLYEFGVDFKTTKIHGSKLSASDVMLILCYGILYNGHHSEAVNFYFDHCFQQSFKEPSFKTNVMALTEKMFETLTKSMMVEESIQLFNGIFVRQKDLLTPLKIMTFYEPTLRCAFSKPYNPKLKALMLRLYLDVEQLGVETNLGKTTCRSIFMTAFKQIKSLNTFSNVPFRYVLHPLVKKLLIKCINSGAYSKYNNKCSEITIFSSMTTEEIAIYIIWWLCSYVASGKLNKNLSYFPLTIKIVTDSTREKTDLPIHPSIATISQTAADCLERIHSALKSLLDIPLSESMIKALSRQRYEFNTYIVRALCQQAVNCLLCRNRHINTSQKSLCTFCFDGSDICFMPC